MPGAHWYCPRNVGFAWSCLPISSVCFAIVTFFGVAAFAWSLPDPAPLLNLLVSCLLLNLLVSCLLLYIDVLCLNDDIGLLGISGGVSPAGFVAVLFVE